MNTYYIINSYINDSFVSTSDIFTVKEDVFNLKKILDQNIQTKNIVFECNPIDSCNVNRCKLYKYLKGYVLIPDKNDPYYEMQRLNNGDWCDDLKGWYYSSNELGNLKAKGYTIDSKLGIDYTNYEINLLEVYFYDNGFILSPKKTYKYYKQKYLLGGIWNNDQNGWYFKNIKKYNKFIQLGAIDMINDTFME